MASARLPVREKVAILKRRLLENEPISKLCDDLGLQGAREKYLDGLHIGDGHRGLRHSSALGVGYGADDSSRHVLGCHGSYQEARSK